MYAATHKPAPRIGWLQSAAIALAIGLSLPLSRFVVAGLTPVLGESMAFGVSLFAAATAGGMAAMLGLQLPGPETPDR